MWLLWTMVMKKKWNPYKKSENLGQLFPRVTQWVWSHHSSRHLVFSILGIWIIQQPPGKQSCCDMAKVGERHLDCSRASVWPTLLSICIPNLLKQWESLLKDREIISLPEIMLPHTSYFHPDERYKCFCITLNFLFLTKRCRYHKHTVLQVGHGTGPVNYP